MVCSFRVVKLTAFGYQLWIAAGKRRFGGEDDERFE
jgi:hypothetical protein